MTAAGLARFGPLLRCTPADLARQAGLPLATAQVILTELAGWKGGLNAPAGGEPQAAAWRSLEPLLAELTQHNASLERATSGWSKDQVSARRRLRQDRDRVYMSIKASLASIGELDLLMRMEKLSFAKRIDELHRLLRAGAAAGVLTSSQERPHWRPSQWPNLPHVIKSSARSAKAKSWSGRRPPAASTCPSAQLPGAALARADLEGANLEGSVLRQANLKNASLRVGSLPRLDFRRRQSRRPERIPTSPRCSASSAAPPRRWASSRPTSQQGLVHRRARRRPDRAGRGRPCASLYVCDKHSAPAAIDLDAAGNVKRVEAAVLTRATRSTINGVASRLTPKTRAKDSDRNDTFATILDGALADGQLTMDAASRSRRRRHQGRDARGPSGAGHRPPVAEYTRAPSPWPHASD